ncbi:MAG: ABC transporter ATP-binding protein [Chloroflexota bacterium]
MIAGVSNVTKNFGGLTALHKVSFTLEKGEILGIIGPNGAGKTTLLNVISGFFTPDEGEVTYKGRRINGLGAHQLCEKGISRTFQNTKPFGEMTALENVMIGAFLHVNTQREAQVLAQEALKMVGLEKRQAVTGYDLTVVDRKRLELARCLATRPDLLLLDEVIAGCTPREMEDMLILLRKLNGAGLTIIMVEHVMKAVMALCQRIVVLNFGEKIAEGTPVQIGNDERVVEAYLGVKYVTS